MIPTRWELERWGRRTVVVGVAMLLLSSVLDRAKQIALSTANGRMEMHEHNVHHYEDVDEEEEA